MTDRKFKFENGDKVFDKITGLKGTITGSVYYITGCNQYLILPKSKDDKYPEGWWIDEDRLELKSKVKNKIVNKDHGPDLTPPIK